MTNTFKVLMPAMLVRLAKLVILALVMAIVFSFTACKSGGAGSTKTDEVDSTFTSAAELKAWLDSQPKNTPETAYNVKLNVSSLGGDIYTNGSVAYALQQCYNKHINLDLSGSTITSIERGELGDLYNLVSVTIPNSVNSIEHNPFAMSSLTTINVNNTNSSYMSDNGVLYNKAKTSLIAYPLGKTDASFSIPNGVISIGFEVADTSNYLTSVTIPSSVNSIGNYAFGRCRKLTSVTFQGTIASTGFIVNPFGGDLVDKYLAGGTGTYTTSAPASISSVWTKQ